MSTNCKISANQAERESLINEYHIKLLLLDKKCIVCGNYGAVHPTTKNCYCKDGSKLVYVDSGCSSWKDYRITKAQKGGTT